MNDTDPEKNVNRGLTKSIFGITIKFTISTEFLKSLAVPSIKCFTLEAGIHELRARLTYPSGRCWSNFVKSMCNQTVEQAQLRWRNMLNIITDWFNSFIWVAKVIGIFWVVGKLLECNLSRFVIIFCLQEEWVIKLWKCGWDEVPNVGNSSTWQNIWIAENSTKIPAINCFAIS